jgi:cytochrome c oxidase subunit 2
MRYELPLFPERASAAAGQVDTLFFVFLGITGVVAAGIIVLILLFVIKYRRRSDLEIPVATPGNKVLEIGWIVTPLLIFVVMYVWGVNVYFRVFSQPRDALEINVVAKRWMWKFQHPEGQREINELHIPINHPIKLALASEDVIHSFFVPDFRLHRDVLPGRYTEIWFVPTKVGQYHLFCSQYCGTQHSGMVGTVFVMEPEDYQRWLATSAQDSLASQGQALFRKLACNTCHTGDSQARGPLLEGLFGSTVYLQTGEEVRADENYLRESIVNPRARTVAGFQQIMPTFQNQVNEEQLLQLVAFIKSLNGSREQIPAVSSPSGPQPSPVEGAIKSSESEDKQSPETKRPQP